MIMKRAELDKYFANNTVYTGEYLETMSAKDFGIFSDNVQSKVREMAKRGKEESAMKKSLKVMETKAKDLGYDVLYNVNEKTNEIEVILIDKGQNITLNNEAVLAEAPTFKLSIGSGTRGGKGRMAAPKSYAPHIGKSNKGIVLLTEVEETINGVTDTLSKLNSRKMKPDRGYVQHEVKKAQRLAEQSIVTTEGYSIVDEDKFMEEMKRETSNARGQFVRTSMRLGGLIGEVVKKSNFTKNITSAQKLTQKELEALNQKADSLVTKYIAIYAQEGEKAADNYFKSAESLKNDFKLSEEEIKAQLETVKSGFGEFLYLPSSFGLSGDEALKTKKFSYVGDRDLAFRPSARTGRHTSQTRNYLERSDRAKRRVSKRQTERFIPKIDKGDMSYYKENGHQLYKRGLVSGDVIKGVQYTPQMLVTKAYEDAADEYIKDKVKKLKKSRKYRNASKTSQAEMEKELREKIQRSLPSIAELGIMEDAGLMSESAAREFESSRTVTATLSEEKFNELRKEAEDKYEKLSDEAKKNVDLHDFVNKFIAKRVLKRSKLTDTDIRYRWAEGDFSISAKERVGGNKAKLLSRYTGARETDVAIPDFIFNRMAKQLKIEGADIISATKKIKAEEVPGYFQGLLGASISQRIAASKSENEVNKVLKDTVVALNSIGFNASVGENGKIFIDNSDEAMDKVDWNKALIYLEDLNILKTVEGGFEFANPATIIEDVINRADTYDPSKKVKTSPKEYASVKRDIAEARAVSGDKNKFTSLAADIDKMYDPTTGAFGAEAKKARVDIDAILNKKTGSVVRTYQTVQNGMDRARDVRSLKRRSYNGKMKRKKGQHYIVSVGRGAGYTIDVSQLEMAAINYQEGGGLLTCEDYKKTVLGAIDKVKSEIFTNDPSATVDIMIDPGTDFGFGMSFDSEDSSEGATGRFLILPNVEIDTVQKDGETFYSLPSYNKEINSLIGSIKEGSGTRGQRAQELNKAIFDTAHSNKGTLWQKANTKRQGGSTSGHITGTSQDAVNKALAEGKTEVAERLASDIWVSKEAMIEMLSSKTPYTSPEGVYNISEHQNFLREAVKHLYGRKANHIYNNLSGTDDEDNKYLAESIVQKITDDKFTGAKDGLAGIMNRFPSIAQLATTFTSFHVSSKLQGKDIMVGAAIAKFVNGDYDGDTLQLVLGLMSSGKSFKEADEMVERQRKKNLNLYRQMFAKDKEAPLDKTILSLTDAQKLSDSKYMGLSALATKFNKPYTGMFSNISTRIREGLVATGFDVIDKQGNLNELSTIDDYINVIRGKLVAGVGQILEQDSISSKKVEKRLDEARAKAKADGRAFTVEDEEKEQLKVLQEFEDLYNMMRNPEYSYSDIIGRMSEMGLFGSDVTQIGSTLSSNISGILKGVSVDDRNKILSRLGITEDDLTKGIFSADVYKNAGNALENQLRDPVTGRGLKIFAGEYGTGLATSRSFTPNMKQDTYELLRFLKASEDVNSVLKKMGEIIDENGNKFNQYGEKIKGAKASLQGEAAQESAKIVIAGKEGKAIDRNADTYQRLSDKLKEAGSDYKAVNRLSTTELKNRLLPYTGLQTTGLDPKVLSKLSKRARKGDVLSRKELVAAFGVKNEEALDSLFMGALSTRRGDYIHELAQGNVKEAKAKRKEITNLFKVFGYSPEQINDTFDIYKLGAKNIRDITKQFGKSMGAEIPFIGMTSDEQYVVNARADELFYKQRQSRWDESKKENVVTIVDYKTHSGGKISDEDIAQGIIYKTFLEDIRDFAKNLDKEISNEEAAEILRNQIKSGFKYTSDTNEIERREKALSRITPNVADALRNGAVIETAIVVNDTQTGAAQAYAIGSDLDKYRQISKMLLSGDTSPLTAEQKVLLRGGARQLTSADYFKHGVDISEKSGIETSGTQERSSSTNQSQQTKNERMKEYLEILRQVWDLEGKMAELDKQIALTEAKQGDTSGLQNRKEALEKILTALQAQAEGVEKDSGGFSDKEYADIEKKTAVNAQKLAYKKSLLGYNAETDTYDKTQSDVDLAYKELSGLYSQRATNQEKADAAQRQIGLSYSEKEKAVLAEIILLQNDKNAAIDEEIAKLQASGLLSDEQIKALQKEYNLRVQLNRAQGAAKNKGATSIWDIMANDIKRAAMRVTDFGLASKILYAVPQSINKIITYAKQLDTAMTNIRIVAELDRSSAESLMISYNKLGKQLGATTTEIAEAANDWLN